MSTSPIYTIHKSKGITHKFKKHPVLPKNGNPIPTDIPALQHECYVSFPRRLTPTPGLTKSSYSQGLACIAETSRAAVLAWSATFNNMTELIQTELIASPMHNIYGTNPRQQCHPAGIYENGNHKAVKQLTRQL